MPIFMLEDIARLTSDDTELRHAQYGSAVASSSRSSF